MLDLVLLAFIALVAAMGLKRPFIWVLLFIYVDLVRPQRIGWGVLSTMPVSLMMFVLAFGGWLILDSKRGSRFALQQALIVLLLLYCGMTTFLLAQFPEDALAKWDWVWKALLFAAFLPLALRTRLRIEAAVLVFVLSIAAIAISGGMKTLGGGGGYGTLRLLVDDNAGIYEGSIFSAAAVSMIPLVWFLARHGTIFRPHWTVTAFAAALTLACLLIPVGTSARTGLVCVGALAVLVLRSVRYRALYAGAAGLALVAALPLLPESFVERMGTITAHEEDQSASTRVAVWTWTIDYVRSSPLGGGFDAYRANSFTYMIPKQTVEGNTRRIEYVAVTDKARAYHSSYFEMLGEQGYIGLLLWVWLHGLGLWQMERVRRWARAGRDAGDAGARWLFGLATALQQAQAVYLVGALFVGIAFQPFAFMIVGMQCALWTHVRLARKAALPRSAFSRPAAAEGRQRPVSA